MHCFYITLLCNGLLKNNDNSNTMTIIIISTYSLYHYTPHLSYIHYSNVSRFKLARNAFYRFALRSAIHQLTSMSTSVRLFSLFFFFFFYPSFSESVPSIYTRIYRERERERERGRAIQKKVQSKK